VSTRFTVTTVCLPKATPTAQLPGAASAALAAHQMTTAGPAGHFLSGTRRTGNLVQHLQGITAGGPVKLLNLRAMREHAHLDHSNLWTLWNDVVTGAPAAKPWWHFHDRHLADLKRYSIAQAQSAYLAQTRVTRMRGYNARPDRLAVLPTGELEILEAGQDAYATYGWLSAVPGEAMLTLDGALLRPHSSRLDDQWSYLEHANAHVHAMAGDDRLVAVATR
jgi:hypothetical protein